MPDLTKLFSSISHPQQWDLNTGNLERAYPASSQVGSLGFRPTGNTYTPSMASFDNKAEAADAEEVDGHFEEDSDAEDIEAALKPSADATSSTLPPLEPTPSPVKNFADAMNPSLPELSSDVLLCASLDGQVSLYDRRAEDAAMRRFGTEKGTPPWAMQACWSPDGQAVYVGRRNASVNVYDLRAGCKQPRRSVHFPPSSGPVTAVQAHPDNRHLLCGSSDNMRLVDLEWSLQPSEDRRHVHYRVVPGYSSGSVSSIGAILCAPLLQAIESLLKDFAFLLTSYGSQGRLNGGCIGTARHGRANAGRDGRNRDSCNTMMTMIQFTLLPPPETFLRQPSLHDLGSPPRRPDERSANPPEVLQPERRAAYC